MGKMKKTIETAKKPSPKPRVSRNLNPLQVGNQVLIRTVTCFQVGKIVSSDAHGFTLIDAAWVADTGRFASALSDSNFSEVEPFCDPIFVSRGAIIDATTFRGQLPLSQK
jgi:hypothetical protein